MAEWWEVIFHSIWTFTGTAVLFMIIAMGIAGSGKRG